MKCSKNNEILKIIIKEKIILHRLTYNKMKISTKLFKMKKLKNNLKIN